MSRYYEIKIHLGFRSEEDRQAHRLQQYLTDHIEDILSDPNYDHIDVKSLRGKTFHIEGV